MYQAFGHILEQVSPQVYREQDFIADFLQINEVGLTFADYMDLENYFRRQASRSSALSQQTVKLMRGAMDLIFGFLPAELKAWIDAALAKDSMCVDIVPFAYIGMLNVSCRQIIGMTACLERFLTDADERGNAFLLGFLEKQHTKLKTLFDRHVVSLSSLFLLVQPGS